jgi:hypothetical protein
MACPWFSRLWVIQELALAKMDPIVLISKTSTTWSCLVEITSIIQDYMFLVPDDLRREFDRGCDQLLALKHIRSGSGRHRGLYQCLVVSRLAIATDPRDKVYGLLGLCDFPVIEPIAIDYSKSLPHVLAEATVISLLEECACPYFEFRDRLGTASHLPS